MAFETRFQLICPDCKSPLREDAECRVCGKNYIWLRRGSVISFQIASDSFYETWYRSKVQSKTISLFLKDFASPLREKISLSTRRERFFRRHLCRDKGKPLILDVACGGGRRLFVEYGQVVGLDIVLEPLYKASAFYDLCVHASAFSIPFPDQYFDYIVSSDFLGHIPLDKKDLLYQEFYRVLKPAGKMLHVMETDAENWHFRFAHKYPALFQRYFVEEIGGHFGLELPSRAIRRLEVNGFKVVEAKKIWGQLWEIQEYRRMFANEYQEKSKLIRAAVILSKALSASAVTSEVVNVALNPISALLERFTPLDNGQGIMIVCQKD